MNESLFSISLLLDAPAQPVRHSMRRKSKLFVRYVALIAAVSLPLSHSGQAASATWNPTPGDANWIPTTGDTDWNTGVNTNPGSTSSLTNADVATFNSASTQTTIAINSATLDIGGITFDTNAASYTIGASGANGGNSLLLSSGGTVQIASTFLGNGTTETINAPVVIEAASSSSIGTYTFANNSTNGSDVLNFAGAITGGTTTATNGNDSGQEGGSIVLLLTGANTGANTLSGAITDGSSQAVVPVSQRGVAINKTGAGIWYLTNNSNTYTGETAIEGGILNVSSLSNYGVASAIGARTASEESNANGGIGLLIAGGTLQYTGASNQSTNRQIRLGNGATDAIDSSGAGTLSFTFTGNGANLFQNGGTRTLILTGSNSGANLFSQNLVDQSGNATTLAKTGTGSWIYAGNDTGADIVTVSAGTLTLTGTNSYTGATTVSGGTLALNFSATGAPATNIINNSANSSALTLSGGGTLSLTGTASTTNSQRLNGLAVGGGGGSIILNANATSNPLLLTLGAITRTAGVGGSVNFTLPTGTQSATNGVTTSNSNANGTLLDFTVGGTDWAAVSGGNIVSYTSSGGVYTTAGATASAYTNANVDVTSSVSPGGAITPNTLRFNTVQASGAPVTLGLLAGTTNVVSSGGILVTSNVGANNTAIYGGTLEGANNQSLDIIQDSTGTITISSIIANNTAATGLNKSGPGTLLLTGANTYTGTTTITGGTVIDGNNVTNGAIGSGNNQAVTLAGGALLYNLTNNTGLGNITLTANSTIGDIGSFQETYGNTVTGNGFTLTYAGSMSATYGIVNSTNSYKYTNGAGQWYNGTYSNLGLLNIASGFFGASTGITGPINVAFGASLGDNGSTVANNITFNGGGGAGGMGAFAGQAANTLSGMITLASGTTSFGTMGGNTGITGLVTGSGALAKSNYNTLTLSNADNYTGVTQVDGGTLALTMSTTAANSVLYNGVTANTLTLGGAPSTQVNQSNTLQSPTLSVTGAASTNNTQTFANTVVNYGVDTITATPGSSGGILLKLGALTQNAGGLLTFTTGTPITAPSATNAITTTSSNINGILGAWATVSGTGFATVSGGNIAVYTAYTEAGTAAGYGTATAPTIASNGANNVIIDAASSNNVTLAATGTTDVNAIYDTRSSGTTLDTRNGSTNGVLRFGPQGGIYASNSSINIGTSANAGSITAGGSAIANNPGEIIINENGSFNLNSSILNNGTGAVSLTLNDTTGSQNVISGTGNYSGGTTIMGGRYNNQTSTSLGTGAVTVLDGGELFYGANMSNNLFIEGNGASEGYGAIRSGGSYTLSGVITLLADALIDSQGSNSVITGQITGNGSVNFSTVNNNPTGQNWILGNAGTGANANNWTGNTVINTNVTQSAANQIPSGANAGNVTVNQTLNLGGFNLALNGINGTSTITNTSAGTPVLSIGNNNQSFIFGGAFTDSGAGKTLTVEKDGNGTVQLTGSSNYIGGTVVDSGILQMGNTYALGGTTGALVMNGGTLDLNNYNLAAASLTGTGAGAVISSYNQGTASALTLTINPTTTGTFAGSIQNGTATSISLVKNGSGTTDLEGANTYTGTTMIDAGTLELGFGGSIANVSGISFALGSSASLALGDSSGANTLTLTAPIGNTASTNSIVGGYSGGNSTLTLNTASGSQSYVNAFGGSTATSKNLNLIIAGSGVTVLSGASTYTGATTVNGGSTLNLGGSLGLTAVTLNSGATLIGANAGAIGGTLTASGSSVISLTNGSGSFSAGATTLGSSGAYNSSDYTTLLFSLGSSVETLALGSNTLTLNSGGVYVDITNPNTLGTYTLATYTDGSAPSGFSLSSTVAGVLTVSLGRNTETLADTAGALTLTIGGTPAPNVAFFDGVVSGKWNDLSNPSFTNFSTNLAGTTDAGNTPASNTDVILNASDVTSGTTETLGASTTINSLTVNGNGTTNIAADGSTLTIAGNADGNTSSDSSYTGNPANRGITIAAGANAFTVNVPIVAATSGSNQTWINGSANLFTVNGNITGSALSGSTQTLTLSDTNSGGTTLSGVIADSAAGKLALLVNNTGAGVTTLNGTNTYSGGTTLNGGTLTATGTGGLGAGFVTVNPINTTATAADNATLNTNSSISTIAAVTVNSEAGDGGFGVGTIYFNGSSPTIGSLSGNGNAVLNNAGGTTLTIGNSSNNLSSTFSGAISGTGGLIKAGAGKLTISGNDSIAGTTTVNAGTLTLSGNNSYTGITTVNTGGTLQLGSSTTLPTNTLASGANFVINTGGTFDLNNFNVTLGAAPTGTGGTITDASATSGTSTLTFSGGGTVVQTLTDSNFTTANTGTLALKLTGGTLTLSNANNYTGGTTVTSGTLVVSNATGAGSNVAASTVNVSGGALVQFTVTGNNIYNYSFGGGGKIDFNFTGGGSGANTSNAAFNGFTGVIELSNPGNTGNKFQFLGDTGVSGATLQVDSGATAYISAGTNNFGAITLTGNGNNEGLGAIRIQGGNLGGNISLLGSATIGDGGGTISGNVSSGVAGTQTLTIVNGAGSSYVNFTGNITNGSGQVALTLNHGGDVTTLSGTDSYSGPTTLTSGTLVAASTTALSSSSAFVLANTSGVGLNIAGFNNTIGSLTGGGTTGGNVSLGAAALTIGADNTSPAAYAGVISSTGSPVTSIVKIGAGTETFSGANTYTGATLINGGILNASSSSALGTGNVTFGGGTLQYGTSGAAGTDLSGRIVSSGSAISLDTDGQTVTYAGALASSNTGGLTLQDSAGSPGSLTLGGVDAYTGATTVTSGALNLTGTLTNSSSVTVNGGSFSTSGNVAAATTVTVNNGSFTVNSGGDVAAATTLAVNGGNFTVNSGGTVAAASTVTVASGAAFTIQSGGSLGSAPALTDNGTVTFNNAAQTVSALNGASTGSLALGAGTTLSVSGGGSYAGGISGSGNLNVTGGTLTVASSYSAANSTGNVNVNGGTLIVSGYLSGAQTTVNSGAILGGTGTINSAVTVAQGGTISAGVGQAFAGTYLTINNNLTLSGTATVALSVDGNGDSDYVNVLDNLAIDPSNTDTLSLTVLGSITTPETVVVALYGSLSGGQFENINVIGNGSYQAGSINYNYQGNDEIAVTLTAVPEPGTWATVLGGMGMLFVYQRRRRASRFG